MRVVEGSGVTERKGRELAELAKPEKPSKSSSKKNKRRQKKASSPPMPSPVQRLLDTCREVFVGRGAGAVPSPADVQRLKSVLDPMKPADVGLNANMTYFRNAGNTGRPQVTYLHLYECDEFSIGIFCLPPSAVIPLHNHPQMSVFSKLLLGTMHIKSYDWVENIQQANGSSHSQPPGMRLAKVKTDANFTAPCDTSILYPTTGGNMHCFTALTACAVLDVLGPPYSDDEGRPCTYYNDFPYANFSDDTAPALGDEDIHAWLEEREKPEDFSVVGKLWRNDLHQRP